MKVKNLLTICGVAAALMLSAGSIFAQPGGGGGGGIGGGGGGVAAAAVAGVEFRSGANAADDDGQHPPAT